MKSPSVFLMLAFGGVLLAPTGEAHSPHGPVAREAHRAAAPHRGAPEGLLSGQGEMQFRVLYTSDRLPAQARAVLEKAHGGFAVDHRPGRGETYFALPGAGILQISPDLATIRLLETDAAPRDTNLHNTTLWQAPDGTPFLTFPANDLGKVFTTNLAGRLLHTLEAPTGAEDLGRPQVNDYFKEGGRFTPTDVDHLRGWLYVTTGYSDLDWVLTANVTGSSPVAIAWHDLAFGGRGTGPGELGTGHGVTVVDGTRVEIADRPHAEIDRFTPEGRYTSTLALPEGSFPCDIDYVDGYAVVGALHGPDRDKGAPIYVLKDDRVVSEVWPKEELGLERFQHIHNAVLKRIGDRFYIIAQSWNPGDFVVLEQVTSAASGGARP